FEKGVDRGVVAGEMTDEFGEIELEGKRIGVCSPEYEGELERGGGDGAGAGVAGGPVVGRRQGGIPGDTRSVDGTDDGVRGGRAGVDLDRQRLRAGVPTDLRGVSTDGGVPEHADGGAIAVGGGGQ